MKIIKQFLLITLLLIGFEKTFSQTIDSLSVFPNPFNSVATIHFELAQSDTITLNVYNVSGQILITYFQSVVLPSGTYNINLQGSSLAAGIYFVRLNIGTTKNLVRKVAKIGAVSGIVDNNWEKREINFFPNPTNDLLNISVPGNKTIIVTDLSGRVVKSFQTNQQIISLSDIENGEYFITIASDKNETSVTQKILKRE